MSLLQVATVGEDTDPLMIGIREFAVTRLALLHTPEFAKTAERVRLTLEPLKLDTRLIPVREDVVLDVLRAVSALVGEHADAREDVIVNAASGTRLTATAATAAAFVNGVKAFTIVHGKPVLLPVLGLGYRELVSPAKLGILRAIADAGDDVDSLKVLSDLTGMEKSLLSYHIRGGRESRGLQDLDLVLVHRGARGRLGLRLTPMGRMVLAACGP